MPVSLDTHPKAFRLSLDPSKYGPAAERGLFRYRRRSGDGA